MSLRAQIEVSGRKLNCYFPDADTNASLQTYLATQFASSPLMPAIARVDESGTSRNVDVNLWWIYIYPSGLKLLVAPDA